MSKNLKTNAWKEPRSNEPAGVSDKIGEGMPELVEQEKEDSDDEDDGMIKIEMRRNDRIKKGIRKPDGYALVMKNVNDKTVNSAEQRQDLEQAKLEEIKLVFKDLKAMELVRREELPEGFKVHNTHLFTVKKFTADSHHDKYKSQLVMHGNEQDSTIYADWSSPMVVIQSSTTCLTLAACKVVCISSVVGV